MSTPYGIQTVVSIYKYIIVINVQRQVLKIEVLYQVITTTYKFSQKGLICIKIKSDIKLVIQLLNVHTNCSGSNWDNHSAIIRER